jgi:hypothetical protein
MIAPIEWHNFFTSSFLNYNLRLSTYTKRTALISEATSEIASSLIIHLIFPYPFPLTLFGDLN